jgi:hypothetical protein
MLRRIYRGVAAMLFPARADQAADRELSHFVEQRARELLKSCVNEEEWAMYRDLGFLRVWGGQSGPDGPGELRGVGVRPCQDRPVDEVEHPKDPGLAVPRVDGHVVVSADRQLDPLDRQSGRGVLEEPHRGGLQRDDLLRFVRRGDLHEVVARLGAEPERVVLLRRQSLERSAEPVVLREEGAHRHRVDGLV